MKSLPIDGMIKALVLLLHIASCVAGSHRSCNKIVPSPLEAEFCNFLWSKLNTMDSTISMMMYWTSRARVWLYVKEVHHVMKLSSRLNGCDEAQLSWLNGALARAASMMQNTSLLQ